MHGQQNIKDPSIICSTMVTYCPNPVQSMKATAEHSQTYANALYKYYRRS